MGVGVGVYRPCRPLASIRAVEATIRTGRLWASSLRKRFDFRRVRFPIFISPLDKLSVFSKITVSSGYELANVDSIAIHFFS